MIRHRLAVLMVPAALAVVACNEPTPTPGNAAAPASAAAPAAASASAPASASASASAPASASASASAPVTASAPAAASVSSDPDRKSPKDAGAPASASAAPPPAASAPLAADDDAGLPPPAEAGSADAVATEVDAIFADKKTFSAHFKQEHTQKVSGVVKKQSGTVAVEKPNKVSFRYDPPSSNRVVSDGTTLKVYVAEDKQMFVTPVQNTEYPGALSFLMGHGLRPSFTFTFNDKAKFDGGPVLVGKPRSPTPHYDSVMFYIDRALLAKKDPGVVRRVLIVDAQGNRNRFDFDGAVQPPSIEPAEFQFTPPPGTDLK